MVQMVKYFNQWSNFQDASNDKYIICLLILAASFLGLWIASSIRNIRVEQFVKLIIRVTVICTIISMVNSFISYMPAENQIIHEAQTEIKKKLDFNFSDKQMRQLLKEQPTWANQLTEKAIKKHLK